MSRFTLKMTLFAIGGLALIWLIPNWYDTGHKPIEKAQTDQSYQFDTPEGPMTIVVGDDVENVNIIDSSIEK